MRLALLAVLALVAGCTSGPPAPGAGSGTNTTSPPGASPEPGASVNLSMLWAHEHMSFALFLAGERVSFNHTDYDLQSVRVVRAHLHVQQQDGEHIIHVEDHFPGGVPNVTLAQFFAVHGLRFAAGSLTLDTRDHHNGTTWNDTAEQRWRVFAAPRDGAFAEVADGPAWVLREGQRILVTYGALTPAQIEGQARAVPEPPPPAQPR